MATHVGDLSDKTLPAHFIMTNVWGKLTEGLLPISGVYYFVFEVFICSEGDVYLSNPGRRVVLPRHRTGVRIILV